VGIAINNGVKLGIARDNGGTGGAAINSSGTGERRGYRHWYWRDMPTWAVPPLELAG